MKQFEVTLKCRLNGSVRYRHKKIIVKDDFGLSLSDCEEQLKSYYKDGIQRGVYKVFFECIKELSL